ncbi:MAG: SLBB domain-containing protein [FCB group bacterium]|nr:SLBB domain-containing protein [FCB group bacterium]MBL7028478.1 SLBB domain-containing protein [Candidatus Neomarinimicrobiota bacterium]MBL7121542.1 SLBB domain-containing protein [Candidatus Neomarinimicrobiota bacterium]
MKHLRMSLLLLLFISCLWAQDFGRMKQPEVDKEESPSFDMELSERPAALEQAVDPTIYILGPGDEIGLSILTSEVFAYPLTVTPTGDLFIPGVGVCHVAGLTITDAMSSVQKFVRDNTFPGAKTYLALLKPRYFKVLVTGAVQTPGFVIETPVSRLDDAIYQVDGFHQLAKEFEIRIIHKDGTEELIDYHKYILAGDLESNPTLIEGDHVQVPFGELNLNGIVVRGSITGAGYDIIAPKETLGNYIQRQVVFEKNADLKNVTLSRMINGNINHMVILPEEFQSTILQSQDEINFMWERGVLVTGFVQNPGGFSYSPGYSVSDYIALAGGNTRDGNPRLVSITHIDGDTEKGLRTPVLRGDVIYIPRTRKDIYIGDMSILSVITAMLTIYLTYLSATGK